MSQHHDPLVEINRSLVWQGFKQFLPISIFVAIFGAAFGLAAVQTGLNPFETMSMSASVFAGASQFATLELWGQQIALLPLIVTVFFINARHILMGASLYPWLKHLPTTQRYGLLLLMSDANWAGAYQAFREQRPGFGILLGGGIALWLFWLTGTLCGIYLGDLLLNPHTWGLDMVMACFLLTIALQGEKNRRLCYIWLTAAVSSLLAYWYLPENMHVVVGALCGGFMGLLLKDDAV